MFKAHANTETTTLEGHLSKFSYAIMRRREFAIEKKKEEATFQNHGNDWTRCYFK